MKIRLLATVALLSVGLSGCVIAPYAMSGPTWSSPDYGGAYYQPAPTYWVTSPTYVVRPAPPPRPHYREEGVPHPQQAAAHHPDRHHEQDERSERHIAGR